MQHNCVRTSCWYIDVLHEGIGLGPSMADLLAEEGAQRVSSSHSRVRRSEVLQGADEGVAELLVRVLGDEVRTGVQACTTL